MLWSGDPGEDSSLVPPAAGGEQGEAGRRRGQQWGRLQPGRCIRGTGQGLTDFTDNELNTN